MLFADKCHNFTSFILTAGAILVAPASSYCAQRHGWGAPGADLAKHAPSGFASAIGRDSVLPLALLVVGIVALIIVAALWAMARRRRTDSGPESECSGDSERDSSAPCDRYRRAMADARTEVVNTAEGVMVRYKGGHPDTVRLLQSYWNEYAEWHAFGSPYPPDSAPTKKKEQARAGDGPGKS